MEPEPKYNAGLKEKADAKLERFAHTLNQTPKKGGQAGGTQHQGLQAGHPVGRRSQGPAAKTPSSAAPAASVVPEGEHGLNKEIVEGISVPVVVTEKEPSLKVILLAINCKSSLFELSDQLKCIREDLLSLKHDV